MSSSCGCLQAHVTSKSKPSNFIYLFPPSPKRTLSLHVKATHHLSAHTPATHTADHALSNVKLYFTTSLLCISHTTTHKACSALDGCQHTSTMEGAQRRPHPFGSSSLLHFAASHTQRSTFRSLLLFFFFFFYLNLRKIKKPNQNTLGVCITAVVASVC